MRRRGRYLAPKPADRTLRVWLDGVDVTDGDPRDWLWPYSDWWAQGWRPRTGPNSRVPGLIEGGVGVASAHGTHDYTNPY